MQPERFNGLYQTRNTLRKLLRRPMPRSMLVLIPYKLRKLCTKREMRGEVQPHLLYTITLKRITK